MSGNRFWKTSELQYLKENYKSEPAINIAAKLGRTKGAVRQYASKNKVTTTLKIKFSREEQNFIRKNINLLTNKQIAEKLKKTLTVTRNEIYRMGLKRYDCTRGSWTDQENKILLDNYTTKGDTELRILLPGRTKKAIRKRRKTLNLQRTQEQINVLVEQGRKKFLEHSFKPGKAIPGENNYGLDRKLISEKIWRTRRERQMKEHDLASTSDKPYTPENSIDAGNISQNAVDFDFNRTIANNTMR